MTKKKKFIYSTVLIVVNLFLIFINNFQVNKRDKVLLEEKNINDKIQKIELFKKMILNCTYDEKSFKSFLNKIDNNLFKGNDLENLLENLNIRDYNFEKRKETKHEKINIYNGKLSFETSFESFNNFLSKFENSIKLIDIQQTKLKRVNGKINAYIDFRYLVKEISG